MATFRLPHSEILPAETEKIMKSGKTKQEKLQVYIKIMLNAIILISVTVTYHQYLPAVISQIQEQAR